MKTLAFLSLLLYGVFRAYKNDFFEVADNSLACRKSRLLTINQRRNKVFNLMQTMIREGNMVKYTQAYYILSQLDDQIKLLCEPKYYN